MIFHNVFSVLGLMKIMTLITLFHLILKQVQGQTFACDPFCLECVNPTYVTILQKGMCFKSCNMTLFSAFYQPCIQFSPETISITNMTITNSNINQYLQLPLVLENLVYVRLYNFTIKNAIVTNNSTSTVPFIIGFNNIANVIISGVSIVGGKNLPTIMRAQSITSIIYLQNIYLYQTYFLATQNAFQIINGNQLKIYGVTVEKSALVLSSSDLIQEEKSYLALQNSNVLFSNWTPPSHIVLFETNGCQYVTLEQILFYQNNRMSLLESYNNYFSNNLQSIITFSVSNVVLNNIQSFLNTNGNTYIGNTQTLIIQRSTFVNNTCANCQGTAINTIGTTSLIIQQSLFINNTALDGGSIYLKNCLCSSVPAKCISIQTSQFASNFAYASGGALMLDNSDINFEPGKDCTIFKDNQALVGGAIRYINHLPFYFQRYSQDQLFNINYNDNRKVLVVFNNTAKLWGKNIGSYPRDFKVDYSNPKELDTDSKGQNKLKAFENESLLRSFQISNIRSGQILNMQIIFLDEEFYPIILKTDQDLPASIRVDITPFYITVYNTNNITAIDGDYHKTSDDIQNGVFIFNNLIVYARPGSKTTIRVSTNIIKIPQPDFSYDHTKTFDMEVVIKMRPCQAGEIYLGYNNGTITYCSPCVFGQYSLEYPKEDNPKQICKLCPENTVGCMQNLIILKNGYWRKDGASDIVNDCYNNQGNCLGQMKDNKGLCKEGHIGPLCEMCDLEGTFWGKRYIQNKQYECLSCDTQGPLALGKAIFFACFIFLYSYVGMFTTQNMNYKILVADYLRNIQILSIAKSAILDETPFYIKALTNYIQIYSAINKINIDIIQSAMQTPSVIAFPIDNLKDIFDCSIAPYLSQQNSLSFYKILCGILIPYVFISVFALIEYVKSKFQKKSYMKFAQSFSHGMIYYQIFFLPSNIKNLFSGVFCRQIGKDFYLQADLSITCYSQQYWENFLVLVLICGVSIGFAILYPFLDMSSSNRSSTSTRLTYGFLFVGYRKKYYYWEIVKMVIRSTIIVFVSTSSYQGQTFIEIAIIIFLLLFGQLILTQLKKPHDRDKFNELEVKCIIVLLIILILNIFIINSQNPQFESVGKIIIAVLHLYFLFEMIIIIVLTKIQAKSSLKYNGFKGYIKRKYKLFNSIQFETINKMRVFKNWKKLLERYAEYKMKIQQQQRKITHRPSKYFQSINRKVERRKTIIGDQQSQTFQSALQRDSFTLGNNPYHSNNLTPTLNQILFNQLISQRDNSILQNNMNTENQIREQSFLSYKQEELQLRQLNSIPQKEFLSNQTSFMNDTPQSTNIRFANRNNMRKQSQEPLIQLTPLADTKQEQYKYKQRCD